MNRRLILILAIACLLAFVGYRLYTNLKPEVPKQTGEDKKQDKGRARIKQSANHAPFTIDKQPMKVKGIVRERKSKKPLSGAEVTLRDRTRKIDLTTDEKGSFEYVCQPNELSFFITASKKGYFDQDIHYFVGRDEGAILELPKCSVIKGIVTYQDQGFPVSKAKAVLFFGKRDSIFKQTQTDSNGEFVFDDVVPTGKYEVSLPRMLQKDFTRLDFADPYKLKIEHPDYCTLWLQNIVIEEDETLSYKIDLERCGVIEGGIYHESSKLPDDVTVDVKAEDCDHFGTRKRLQTEWIEPARIKIDVRAKNCRGKYTLKLPAGYYHIITYLTGNYAPYKSGCIRLVAGERITNDIYLKTGMTITGIVTDETLKPLSNVDVTISFHGDIKLSAGGIVDVQTTEDGKFTFEGLPDGYCEIWVPAPHESYDRAVVENVKAGTSGLRIILKKKTYEDKKADIEVKITTLTGQLSKYPQVAFIDKNKEDWSCGGSGKDGMYTKDDYLPEGSYIILAYDEELNLYGIIDDYYVTKMQKNSISVVLDKKGAEIRGKFLNTMFPCVYFKLFLDKEKKYSFFDATHRLDKEGNFRISGLPPGWVTITPGIPPEPIAEFEIQPCEVKDLGTIDLKK